MISIQRPVNGLVITRSAVIDRVEGLFDSKVCGEIRLHFRDRTYVSIESRHVLQALKAFEDSYGPFDTNGDLQVRIKGKRIVYCMTGEKCLLGFTPYEEWDGAELGEGDFLVDIGCCC